MSIQTTLDDLRGNISGCDLAAYADLSSGLALSWSSEGNCPREILDELTARASRMFSLCDQISDEENRPLIVTRFSPGRSEFLLRANPDSSEVLCVIASAETDPDTIAEAASVAVSACESPS